MIPTSVILTDCAQPLANYPHAKKVGNILYLSGISAREPSGKVRGVSISPNGETIRDIQEQTRGVIENMQAILKAAGGDLANLVDMSVFLTDMAMYKDFNLVYNEYFDAKSGPSRTTVGVQSLPGPDLVIEIKGVAYIQ